MSLSGPEEIKKNRCSQCSPPIPNKEIVPHSSVEEILGKLVNQGDVWPRAYLADYVDYVMKEENNSLLIITWDEDSGGKGCKHPCPTLAPVNRIPTIFVGAKVKSGYRSSIQYTHYSLLRTILDMYDLPLIGVSQLAESITDIWK